MSLQKDLNIYLPTRLTDYNTSSTWVAGENLTDSFPLANSLGTLIVAQISEVTITEGASITFIAQISKTGEDNTWVDAFSYKINFDNISDNKAKRIWCFSPAGPLGNFIRIKAVIVGTPTLLEVNLTMLEETKSTRESNQNER